MKVLLVGGGGVGEAIAVLTKDRPWMEASPTCSGLGSTVTSSEQGAGFRRCGPLLVLRMSEW